MENETIEERVARGAAWLDSICPTWRGQIKVDRLDMGSARSCVLGQLFTDDSREDHFLRAGYWHVLRQLSGSADPDEWAAAYGFKSAWADWEDSDDPYGELRLAWRRELRKPA